MENELQDSQQTQRLNRRVGQVCDQLGTFIEWWGFRAIDGRVWALLAIHGSAMSQADIARSLDVSRSLVHSAVTELEQYGLLQRVGEGRFAPWSASVDVWPVITQILRSREWMMLEEIRVTIDTAIEEAELEKRRSGNEPWSIKRLYMLRALTEMAQQFLRVILAFRDNDERTGLRDTFRNAGKIITHIRQAMATER